MYQTYFHKEPKIKPQSDLFIFNILFKRSYVFQMFSDLFVQIFISQN